MKKTQLAENIFVLGYIVSIIGLLTLSPFDFQAFVPSEFWVIRASIEDVSRNILLFLPLGIVLRHAFKRPHWVALLCGFSLSLAIECTQLFIMLRTSNVVDLATNTTGALLGSILYSRLYAQLLSPTNAQRITSGFAIAFMLAPLCWLNAFRSITDPPAAWLAGVNAIAGITLLQSSLSTSKKLKYKLAGVWAAIALIPLANTSPKVAPIIFVAMPIAVYLSARFSAINARRCCVSLTAISALIVTWRIVVWQLSPEISLPNTHISTDEAIVRVAELVLSIIAAATVKVWSKP